MTFIVVHPPPFISWYAKITNLNSSDFLLTIKWSHENPSIARDFIGTILVS